MAKRKSTAANASHGQKMIEVKLRFWTDNLANESGKIVQKNAWTSGVVRMEPNTAHGIRSSKPEPFNSLLDVGFVIEKTLMKHGIVLHPSKKMRKYLE